MIKKQKLQKSWIWPYEVSKLIKSKIKGTSINVCSGKSAIGDIKIDVDPKDKNSLENHIIKRKNIIKADFNKLPIPDNSFDTVISDPAWKIGFYQRPKPFFECVRICKPGGIIIYNAYWIPNSKYVKLKEIYVRQDYDWSNASIISIFEKKISAPISIS